MRPKLRNALIKLSPAALVVACTLAFAASAPGITLYDGSYSTDMSSSTPTGLAPASGTVMTYPESNLRLYWNQVPGSDQYQLQLARQEATNADCGAATAFQLDNIVLTVNTTQNEWVPSMATTEDGKDIWAGGYCWRVRTTGKGYGDWSASHRFTRTWSSAISGLKFYNDHDGAVPRATSAADYATGSTVTRNAGYVTWNDLPGAATYEVQVSSSQSFAKDAIVTTRDGISDNRAVLLHLPDDTYYWRVRGIAPNGTEGGWSVGANAFTVRWLEADWSSDARTTPADSSTQSQMRIGWTPMPGATHYEIQVSTSAGCFWNPDAPELAPLAYGHWTTYASKFDESDPPNLLYTHDPQVTHCRLSDIRSTSINNWATLDNLIGEEAWDNIRNTCLDDEDIVQCEPAGLPTTLAKDWGSRFHGLSEGNGTADDGRYGNAYQIYWRVRPVYQVTQDDETGWSIGGGEDGLRAYGSWTKYTGGGANRHHRFALDPSTAVTGSTGTRCEDIALNPTGACLEHIGTSMQADEAPGDTIDRSMQFPVFTWKPFSGAGGYILEIARDPLFNNIARTISVATGWQQSYALTGSLPDNSEDTGYWWRVVPCDWENVPNGSGEEPRCMPIYAGDSAGLPASYGLGGFADEGVAQTFPKQSAMQVSVSPNFDGAAPLLRWTRSDRGATDYPGWSTGLEGADHYELELARDPFFSQELVSIKTSIPRVVPFIAGDTAGKNKPLPDGLWYYRVRAIDRDALAGAWSTTASFNKRVEAPVPTGTDGEAGPGVNVTWSPVQGAGSYDVQWSTDMGFEGTPNEGSSKQSMFRIPSTTNGTFYWRVRADVNGVKGSWSSQVRTVRIIPATTLRYALNRDLTLAGDKIQITGELRIAGEQANGQRVRLQRKTGGCDASSGTYVDSSTAITGASADDGMVTIPAKVVQNTCFRLAWVNDAAVKYSAPIAVKVAPNVRIGINRKLMRRGQSFCATMTSNVALNGRMRIQYLNGRTWATTRTVMLRNVKGAKTCAKITKAGRYKTRVLLDNLNHRTARWKQYETVTRGSGVVRVNDVWRIVRGR